MQDDTPEPMSRDEVLALVQQVMRDVQFAERNADYTHKRAELYGQVPVVIPGLTNLQTQYHWPKIRKDATRFKDRLLAAPMKYSVASSTEGPRATTKAQNMENFGYRLFGGWLKTGALDGATYDMVTMGRGCLHLRLNADVLPMTPSFDDAEDPAAFLARASEELDDFASGERSDLFIVESVLPETVYWTPDKDVKIMAARVPLNPMLAAYNAEHRDSGGRFRKRNEEVQAVTSLLGAIATDVGRTAYSQTVTLYVVEDAHFVYHVLFRVNDQTQNGTWNLSEGGMLGLYKNVFGTPCFFDLDGERTGDPHALFSALPLIDGMYDVGPLISIMGTLIESAGIEAAQAQETLEPMPGSEAAAEREDIDPNAMQIRMLNDKFRLPPAGYRIVPSGIKLPTDVMQAYEVMQKEGEGYGYPVALAQPQELQVKSGYDRARAQEGVTDVMDPPLQHIAQMLNDILRACFSAVKELPVKGVTVRNLIPSAELGQVGREVEKAITLTADDIIDADTSVSFDSITEASRIGALEEAMKLYDKELMHKDELLADVRGVDDLGRWYTSAAVSQMRAVALAAAIKDATAAFEAVRQYVAQGAVQDASLKPPLAQAAAGALGSTDAALAPPPAPGGPPTGDQPLSMPTGVDTAMPLTPTPPAAAEGAGLPGSTMP